MSDRPVTGSAWTKMGRPRDSLADELDRLGREHATDVEALRADIALLRQRLAHLERQAGP